jgi:hypothetical protein
MEKKKSPPAKPSSRKLAQQLKPQKRKPEPPQKPTKMSPPKMRKAEQPLKKAQNNLPVVNIHPETSQKADREYTEQNYLRADGDVKGDFSVNVDPSTPTNVVPENDPNYGKYDHPAAVAVGGDGSMEMNRTRNTLGDEVSAATDATKRTGAALPKSLDKSLPNITREAQLAQITRNETKNEIKSTHAEGSTQPGEDLKEGLNVGRGTAPEDSAVATQQAAKASQSDTLRPLFGMANPLDTVPSTRDQIKSGILFNDFHIVAPGYGLGANNKMYLMNELRENKIHYREPLELPRASIGPYNTVLQPPLEWQNHITKEDMSKIAQSKLLSHALVQMVELEAGQGSLNTLGDDYGLLRSSSAKGLPRPKESPFEPIFLKPQPMERVRPLAGCQLSTKCFRRLFDAERWPEHFDKHMGMEGGSHYGRRNALRLLPFPLGMT